MVYDLRYMIPLCLLYSIFGLCVNSFGGFSLDINFLCGKIYVGDYIKCCMVETGEKIFGGRKRK